MAMRTAKIKHVSGVKEAKAIFVTLPDSPDCAAEHPRGAMFSKMLFVAALFILSEAAPVTHVPNTCAIFFNYTTQGAKGYSDIFFGQVNEKGIMETHYDLGEQFDPKVARNCAPRIVPV